MPIINSVLLFFIWSFFICCYGGRSSFEKWRQEAEMKAMAVSKIITVSPIKGTGDFQSIQAAVDSIPPNNNKWVQINVMRGTYREKVEIPADKPFIYILGLAGHDHSVIEYDGTSIESKNVTFSSNAKNLVVRNMGFKNTYNHVIGIGKPSQNQAVAVEVRGDKSAFYNCSFWSYQDTLLDSIGRHYFKDCTISGAVDFIFGSGQSIYENCHIEVIGGKLRMNHPGFITAQARNSQSSPEGFVFKFCNIFGSGKASLGRAWGAYSRVIFYNTFMADVITPLGWDAWSYVGHENQLTYAEEGCSGAGSNLSQRVQWEKKLTPAEVAFYTSISFIDNEGWISQLPLHLD